MGKHYKTWNLEKVNMPVSMLLIMMLQILFISSASFILHYMMLIVNVSMMYLTMTSSKFYIGKVDIYILWNYF